MAIEIVDLSIKREDFPQLCYFTRGKLNSNGASVQVIFCGALYLSSFQALRWLWWTDAANFSVHILGYLREKKKSSRIAERELILNPA